MDGTLTISAHDFDHIRRELGLSLETPILEALNAMPAAEAAPLWATLNELESFYAMKSTVMPGAADLLQRLHDEGRHLAILTRNVMPVVHQTLKACAIDHFFVAEHLFDRDACSPKPSPAGINQLLEIWQAKPSDAVMVGDYLFDLEAGKNAGVSTVHIDLNGEQSWPELTDLRVSSLFELNDHLR